MYGMPYGEPMSDPINSRWINHIDTVKFLISKVIQCVAAQVNLVQQGQKFLKSNIVP